MPPTEPMLPFVMLPRPLQESNVVGKGGSAGFLGKAFDPYTLFPDGDDMDMAKMDRIKVDDLKMRPDVFAVRLERRAKLRDLINAQMPAVEKAVEKENLDEYYQRAMSLVTSGRARDAFDLSQEADALRDKYGRNTFGQSCLLARRLIEAGTRVVEVDLAEDRQLRQPLVGPPLRPHQADEGPVGPDARHRPVRPDRRHGQPRHARRHAAWSASANSAAARRRASAPPATATRADGRDHWPYCYTAVMAGAGIKRGYVHGKSDATASSPLENPVHPIEILATIYHALGIHPETIVYNHLNQPRELVKAQAVTALFA